MDARNLIALGIDADRLARLPQRVEADIAADRDDVPDR